MKKIAFMFPGVGSQYTGMGKEFYETSPVVKETFEEASEILGINVADICFTPAGKKELDKLEISQSSLLTQSVACFRLLNQEIGAEPKYCLGHSLGEYPALCCSGVIQFADALKLVRDRGIIIKEVSETLEGTMMWIINIQRQEVETVCQEVSEEGREVYVSAYDSPSQLSISGRTEGVMEAGRKLEEKGAIAYPLKMSGPFHCPLMQPAAEKMGAVLREYTSHFHEPLYPVISNRYAIPYTGSDTVVENLSQQLVSPIRWQDSLQYLEKQGIEMAIEIGPKDVLAFLLKKNMNTISTFITDKPTDIELLKEQLLVKEEDYMSVIGRALGAATSSRNYNHDPQEYQDKVVKLYRKVETLYRELTTHSENPTFQQAEETLSTLKDLLKSKNMPSEEQEYYIGQALQGKILRNKTGEKNGI
jgi:[acyl-carrier-protein] S-malonyltransferase